MFVGIHSSRPLLGLFQSCYVILDMSGIHSVFKSILYLFLLFCDCSHNVRL